jgi:hypothetical protein
MARETTVFPDKKKYIYLYCHTVEEKKRYERLAKEAGISLSKFLLNAIEIGLNPSKKPVSSDVVAVEEELNRVRDELRITRILLGRYQEELQKAKAAPTLKLDKDLCELFQRAKKPLSEDDIIKRLSKAITVTTKTTGSLRIHKRGSERIMPHGRSPEQPLQLSPDFLPASDRITDIGLQIERMEKLGIIRKVGNKGWVWNA